MTKVHDVGFTCLGGRDNTFRVNVIFVHGLRGHPKRTWGRGSDDVVQGQMATSSREGKSLRSLFRRSRQISSPGSTKDPKSSIPSKPFWPAEFLTEDIPEARVWTYGYNANILEGIFQASNSNSVSQHGRDLAVQFEREIDDDGPVIFVAHSLGGIVVKDAIRRSQACRLRTKLVVFLGTPHRGSQFAGWGAIAINLASIALQETNKKIFQHLEVNSEVLNMIHEEFVTFVHQSGIKIHSFQEGRAPPGIKGLHGKVVDDFSSKLDLPRTIETVESIDADHSQMTKFVAKDDAGYRHVASILKKFVHWTLKNKELVSEQVSTRAEATTAKTSITTKEETAIFLVPFSINRQFVGRTEILKTLRGKLFKGEEFQKVALAGLGGLGKTQIAIQLAFWTKEHMPGYSVFWIPALSDASIGQACEEIVQRCGIQKQDRQTPKELVEQYLSSPSAGKWLLIVDDANDTDIIFSSVNSGGRNWLPPCNQGRILFTTRSSKLAFRVATRTSDVVKLSQMNLSEGTSYLEKSLHRQELLQNKKAIADLLGALTYLPLAIKQATSYINDNELTVAEYLDLLRNTYDDQAELLSSEFPDDTRYEQSEQSKNAVATTLLISFSQIQEVDKFAAALLSFMAFIEPKAIPKSMLPMPRTKQHLTASLGTLCSYGFLKRNYNGQMFEMHRLVHLSTRVWTEKQDLVEETLQNVAAQIEAIFPTHDWENRELWRQYLPHALAILRISNQNPTKDYPHGLAFLVGRCLEVDGRLNEAIIVLKKSIAVGETTLAKDDHQQLQSQSLLADAYQKVERNQDAIKLLEPLVSMLQETRPEDDTDLLDIQQTLSLAYGMAGKIKDAIQLIQHVVEIRDAILPEDDAYRLFARHQLAFLCWKDEQIEESIQILEEVVSVRRTVLVEDDPALLVSQQTLASAYLDRGRFPEAIQLLEHVVTIRARTLLADHPSRLVSQNELARAYLKSGKTDEAIRRLEHMVAKQQKTLPKHHPSGFISEHTLACAYLENGDVDEAIERLESLIAKEKKALREDHRTRLASQHVLARAYFDKHRTQDAINLLEHVVAIRQGLLEEDHSDRLGSEALLANAYLSCEQVKKAIQLLQHVTLVRQRTSVAGDTMLLSSMEDMARAYEANGQIQEAIELLKKVVDDRAACLKEDDPVLLASQHNLGLKYRDAGQLKNAIALFEKIVETETLALNDDDPARLDSQCRLARAYLDDGQARKAINLLENVVDIRAASLKEDNSRLLASQHKLARAYLDDGQVKRSINLLEKVVTVDARILEEDDPGRLDSQYELAQAYLEDGQASKAIDLLKKVVTIEARVLDNDDFTRLESQHGLGRAYLEDGQIKQAIALLDRVVSIRETVLSKGDPDLSKSCKKLCEAYEADGQLDKANEMQGRSGSVE